MCKWFKDRAIESLNIWSTMTDGYQDTADSLMKNDTKIAYEYKRLALASKVNGLILHDRMLTLYHECKDARKSTNRS